MAIYIYIAPYVCKFTWLALTFHPYNLKFQISKLKQSAQVKSCLYMATHYTLNCKFTKDHQENKFRPPNISNPIDLNK